MGKKKNRVSLLRMAVPGPRFFLKAVSVFPSFGRNRNPALPGDEAGRGIRSGRALPGATASSSGPGGLAAAPRARRALSPPLVSESHDQVGHDRYMNCHSSVFTMGRGRG